jgi:hypothetical protein
MGKKGRDIYRLTSNVTRKVDPNGTRYVGSENVLLRRSSGPANERAVSSMLIAVESIKLFRIIEDNASRPVQAVRRT